MFNKKTISQDGMWIAGRPWSRRDPPEPRKKRKESQAIWKICSNRTHWNRLSWFYILFWKSIFSKRKNKVNGAGTKEN